LREPILNRKGVKKASKIILNKWNQVAAKCFFGLREGSPNYLFEQASPKCKKDFNFSHPGAVTPWVANCNY